MYFILYYIIYYSPENRETNDGSQKCLISLFFFTNSIMIMKIVHKYCIIIEITNNHRTAKNHAIRIQIKWGSKSLKQGKKDIGILQKQPFADVVENRCSLKFHKIHKNSPVLESLFYKVSGLQACEFCKNSKDNFSHGTSGRLLLILVSGLFQKGQIVVTWYKVQKISDTLQWPEATIRVVL